jgi:hypothetical protein
VAEVDARRRGAVEENPASEGRGERGMVDEIGVGFALVGAVVGKGEGGRGLEG